jgi:hypothetical protein
MIKKTVVFHGGPRVGKTGLIEQAMQLLGIMWGQPTRVPGKKSVLYSNGKGMTLELESIPTPSDRFLLWIIRAGQTQLELVNIPGSVIFRDQMELKLFQQADAVAYVLAHHSGQNDFHREIFAANLALVRKLNKHWDDIPWLFVCNKADVNELPAILDIVPPPFQNDVIRTSAKTGRGVPELWQRINEMVFPPEHRLPMPSPNQ